MWNTLEWDSFDVVVNMLFKLEYLYRLNLTFVACNKTKDYKSWQLEKYSFSDWKM